jgi:hypothetical protein
MPRSSSASSFYRAPLKASALVLALAAATSAMAAENGNQRYSAGIGGSDMTTPVVPGLYVPGPDGGVPRRARSKGMTASS